jgi:DNA-binding winged helix-turn-helix (wHTH) protein
MDGPTYHFGEFQLSPAERSLEKAGVRIPLPPKTMDALLYLVSKSERLVSKRELIENLWPETFVGDANLTNIVVALRKALGQDAIQTISKHGYRFTLAAQGVPSPDTKALVERFARAKELVGQRSIESIERARNLFWICIAEDPAFASAWAWLGRCCWQLFKFCGWSVYDAELASAAFDRAFTLDPNLAIAHQFYTSFQVDRGQTRGAMNRLLRRLRHHPEESETLSGLVQVLRCCGLLDESVEVSKRASQTDPAITTSVPHTYFLQCDYRASIDSYGGRAGYYLDAAAWAALGSVERARTLLTERLTQFPALGPMNILMRSLNLILENRLSEAAELMRDLSAIREPEGLVYFARHCSQIGMADQALHLIERASSEGFVAAPETLTRDPALLALRKHKQFPALLKSAEQSVREARAEWKAYASGSA